MTDEFSCLPSDIERELARTVVGRLDAVVECRSFERAYRMAANSTRPTELPDHPLIHLVQEFEADAAREELQTRG